MDVSILLNLIDDLLREETSSPLKTRLDTLMTNINQSKQGGVETGETITKSMKEISDISSKSVTNSLTRSYQKILNTIEGQEYFGDKLQSNINTILIGNQYNISYIETKIKSFQEKRNAFLQTIKSIQNSLIKLGLSAHYHTEEIYEVGVIIPDKDNLHTTPLIEKQIHNWNFVFRTLSEIKGQEAIDSKIDRVSEGCIELFFAHTFEVAEAIGTILSKIALIYVTIKQIKSHRDALKKLNVPTAETKIVQDHEKKLIDDTIEEAAEEIIKKSNKKIEVGRKNELKTGLNKSIRFIARSIDNGIEVEIIPPYLGGDDETDSNSQPEDAKKTNEEKAIAKKKKQERIDVIKKSGNVLKDVAEVGTGVLKLLNGGEDNIEEK